VISLAGKELVVEGSTVGQGIKVEMVGQGLADISKGGAPAGISVLSSSPAKYRVSAGFSSLMTSDTTFSRIVAPLFQ